MARYPAERIVVRCPNWIGDMVAATMALRAVRRTWPRAQIALWLQPYVRPVVENGPWFDEIIEQDPRRGVGGMLEAAKQLRAGRFDLALLLTHSFSSALTARLGRAARRVGHARNGRSWLLTDAVPWPGRPPRPEWVPKVKVYGSLLEYLGCEGAANQRPELFTSPADEAAADRLLTLHARDESRALLAVVPGAAYGASKLWAPERFARVADELSRGRRMQAVILAGPGEGAIGREIASKMKESPVLFREGEVTFGALKALVRRCALMLCNDTGPRHVAIAYNVPVVVLMGPTSPVVTESSYERTVVVRQEVPCGPCYLRTCPTDHRCMEAITPEMVVGAAEDLLARYGTTDGARA
jgi:heptosyltransferase-2